jgi:hypothetical protein
MEERQAELLPLLYFHIVFTLPAALGDIAYQNKAVIYDLLFKASTETMLTIAADPKHLGARIAITPALHRPATAAAVPCSPLRRRSSITRATIAPAYATRIPGPARSPTRHAQRAGAPLNQTPKPSRRNPHSSCGTGVPHESWVPSLEAFRRRPRCLPHCRDGPASETLHIGGWVGSLKWLRSIDGCEYPIP